MKAQRGVQIQPLLLQTAALDVDEWSTPRPGRFTLGEEKQYQFYWCWVGFRSGLDGCRKSLPQTVSSRYNYCAIPVHKEIRYLNYSKQMAALCLYASYFYNYKANRVTKFELKNVTRLII